MCRSLENFPLACNSLRKITKISQIKFIFFYCHFFQQTFGLIVTFVKLTKSAELTTLSQSLKLDGS